MQITIVGAGAMGSLFGGLLSEAGAEVQLFDIREDHVQALNTEGLVIEGEGEPRRIPLKAFTTVDALQLSSLVLIFVKSMHTAAAARIAQTLTEVDGFVLTLQNGMGNVEQIEKVVALSKIIAGTTSHGATFLGPGRIRHAGKGPTTIGFWYGGEMSRLRTIADLFNAAGIETRVSGSIRDMVWDKLLVNVGINAITALTGIKNGQLPDLPATRRLAQAAVAEAVALAKAKGIDVRQDAAAHVFEIAARTSGNRSSMGQDVDHRRRTEIDAINGFVVRECEAMGLDAPVNRTLTALVETLQHHF